MICNNCKTLNDNQAKFCENCGEVLSLATKKKGSSITTSKKEKLCTNCRTHIPVDKNFCESCEKELLVMSKNDLISSNKAIKKGRSRNTLILTSAILVVIGVMIFVMFTTFFPNKKIPENLPLSNDSNSDGEVSGDFTQQNIISNPFKDFENADHLIRQFCNLNSSSEITSDCLRNIYSIEISNEDNNFYGRFNFGNEQAVDFVFLFESVTPIIMDLSFLNDYTDLRFFSFESNNRNNTIVLSDEPNYSIESLHLRKVHVVNNLENIDNYKNLWDLHASDCGITSIENIAKNEVIVEMTLSNNQLVSSYEFENKNYYYLDVSGNVFWDHRGFKNVDVIILISDSYGYDNFTTVRDYSSRQLYIYVDALRIRYGPSTDDYSDSFAIQGAYYYILDEYWDAENNWTWYKINNFSWVAGKLGEWVELHE